MLRLSLLVVACAVIIALVVVGVIFRVRIKSACKKVWRALVSRKHRAMSYLTDRRVSLKKKDHFLSDVEVLSALFGTPGSDNKVE